MTKKYYPHENLLPFYINWQLEPDNPNYNLAFYYKLKKEEHIYSLIDALNILVSLSPHLRQTFHLHDKRLVATIHEELGPNITIGDSSGKNINALIKKAAEAAHDLNKKSSINLNVIKTKKYFFVVFNIHHIIMDGVSLDNFIKNLNHLINGEKIEHIDLNNFLKNIQQELPERKNAYITQKMKKYVREMNMETEKSYKKTNKKNTYLHYKKTLPTTLHQQLIQLSQLSSLSIFNLLLIANSLFTAKLFNTQATVITYPVNIRKQKSTHGCFVQLTPIYFNIDKKDTFLTLIEKFKKNLKFYKIFSKSHNQMNNNIYDCPSFAESNIAKPLPLMFEHTENEAYTFPQIAKSIISIKYRNINNILYFTCDIGSDVFPIYLSQTILERYFIFIDNLMNNNTTEIIRLSLLFKNEREYFSNEIKKYEKIRPENKSICQIFEHYADKQPNNTALIYNGSKITYSELNQHANQMARYLSKQKESSGKKIVAIFLSRHPTVIISILAVLKMGYSYVNLSKNSPNNRIKFILEDTQAKLIVTEAKLYEKIKQISDDMNINIITIDEPSTRESLSKISSINLPIKKFPHHLAHIIYTSGTTGIPKGVLITHTNVVSLVVNTTYLQPTTLDTFILFADLTFDAATFEIWGALLNGCRLFIPTERLEIFANPFQFREIIAKYQVNIVLLTKTIFDQIYHIDPTIFSPLKYLLIGGEALNRAAIEKLSCSQHKPLNLINAYGPTENTTISTIYKIEHNSLINHKTVPIGKAISNRLAFVLDLNKNPLPPGAVGELYVGGQGVSKGYLNQKKLSNKKFTHVYFNKNKIKMYQTGDLARLLDDGNIEYLGRNDHQIKIRGYRIELSEIENCLSRHPNIAQAIVLPNNPINNDSKDTYLIAYYKSKTNIPIIDNLLSTYLKNILPEYMIPTSFVFLTEFPTTNTGKLDIKKLPQKEPCNLSNIVPPTNFKEKIICSAFEKVLNLPNISINHDFFEVGGNSILAIELSAILHDYFNIHVSDIFKLRTPREIASQNEILDNNIEKKLIKIKKDLKQASKQSHIYRNLNEKISEYFNTIHEAPQFFSSKKIHKIILTGSTGYLGCNLLKVILDHTHYKIFLLIRADSVETAQYSINRKFKFYFDTSLEAYHGNRIFVIKSDIEKDFLGISHNDYSKLCEEADSIIHCAALTKHYGEYEEFYRANVAATINLLELSKKTLTKDFHFISTISTLDNNYISPEDMCFFTEDDNIDELNNQPNFYIKTKHEAEKKVMMYRKHGVSSNVYRVGNLAFISENYRVQENIEDNAFFSRIKCLLTLKIAAKEIGLEEISPVDLTALAIVKIMDKTELSNQTFHVFNPNLCNIADYLSKLENHDIIISEIEKFIERLAEYLSTPNEHHPMIMRFLLHQNWLDGADKIHILNFVLQNRTNIILKNLGFSWPEIKQNVFLEVIKNIQ